VDISVPLASRYRTGWTSAGIVAGWALAGLALSYYARGRIGAARWRTLHRVTALAWVLGLAHSLGEGTDAGQVWFLAMVGTVIVPAGLLLALRWARPLARPRIDSGRPARPSRVPPRVEAG
jgi:sulfoxide reductase heme-binding subunit YedZ